MEDALNDTLSSEELWESGKSQEAIALEAVRALFLKRGRNHLEQDIPKLHGKTRILNSNLYILVVFKILILLLW